MKKIAALWATIKHIQYRNNLLAWIFILTAGILLYWLPAYDGQRPLIWGVLGLAAIMNLSLSLSQLRVKFTPAWFYSGLILYAILLQTLNRLDILALLIIFPLNLVVISFASFFYGIAGSFFMALLVGGLDLAGSLFFFHAAAVDPQFILRMVVYIMVAIFLSSPGEEVKKLLKEKDEELNNLNLDFSVLVKKNQELSAVVRELEASQVEIKEVLRKKELILNISQTLTQSLELKELLSGVLTRIREVFWFHTGGFFLFKPGKEELFLAQSLGAYEKELNDLLSPEMGLVAIVCRTCRELDIRDVSADPRFEYLKSGVHLGSALFLPIALGKESYGCLVLWHPQKGAFSETALETLKSVARETAFAIRNLQLYQELDERLNFSVTLWEASRNLAASLSLGIEVWEAALSETLQRILRLFRADTGVLYRYSEESRQMTPFLLAGLPEDFRSRLVISIKDKGIEQSPLLSSTFQVKDAPRRADLPEIMEISRAAGLASLLWTNISGRKNKILGGICFASKESRNWSKEDLQWLDIFANFFSITMENLTLFHELLSQRNRLQLLVDNIPEGVATTDLQGHILTWNNAAVNITGWEFENVVGKSCSGFLKCQKEAQELCEKFCPLKQSMETLSRYTAFEDLTISTRNGEIPVALTAAPVFNEDEKLSGAMLVFRDVTKEKELEELKEEFFAAITHDLKSPLSSILGYSELLRNPRLGELNGSQSEILDAVIRSSKTLQLLIDNVLESTRLKAGYFAYNPGAFNVDLVLLEVREIFLPLLTPKELKLELKSESRLMVYADREKLKEVLVNLIANAVEFSPQGGKIKVVAESAKDKVRLAVGDQGNGIPPEKIANIFEKFVKLQSGQKGSGLGLFIVKKLLQLEGSQIKVESQLGVGTTFSFELPAKKAQKTEIELEESILVIQSDRVLSERLSHVIIKQGYSPIRAYDLREARALLKMEKPALILVDGGMFDPEQKDQLEPFKLDKVPLLILSDQKFDNYPVLSKHAPEEELLQALTELLKK